MTHEISGHTGNVEDVLELKIVIEIRICLLPCPLLVLSTTGVQDDSADANDFCSGIGLGIDCFGLDLFVLVLDKLPFIFDST